MLVIRASKAYSRSSKQPKHNTKKRWKLYVYDENGHFSTQRVSAIKAFITRFQKHAHITRCKQCHLRFISYNRKCPNCENS